MTPLPYGGILQPMFLPTLLQGKIPIQHFIVFFSATQTISQLSGTQVSSHKLSKVQPALFDIVFPNTLGTFAPEEELWMCYNSKSYKNTSEMALQFQLIDVWQALVPLLKKKWIVTITSPVTLYSKEGLGSLSIYSAYTTTEFRIG